MKRRSSSKPKKGLGLSGRKVSITSVGGGTPRKNSSTPFGSRDSTPAASPSSTSHAARTGQRLDADTAGVPDIVWLSPNAEAAAKAEAEARLRELDNEIIASDDDNIHDGDGDDDNMDIDVGPGLPREPSRQPTTVNDPFAPPVSSEPVADAADEVVDASCPYGGDDKPKRRLSTKSSQSGKKEKKEREEAVHYNDPTAECDPFEGARPAETPARPRREGSYVSPEDDSPSLLAKMAELGVVPALLRRGEPPAVAPAGIAEVTVRDDTPRKEWEQAEEDAGDMEIGEALPSGLAEAAPPAAAAAAEEVDGHDPAVAGTADDVMGGDSGGWDAHADAEWGGLKVGDAMPPLPPPPPTNLAAKAAVLASADADADAGTATPSRSPSGEPHAHDITPRDDATRDAWEGDAAADDGDGGMEVGEAVVPGVGDSGNAPAPAPTCEFDAYDDDLVAGEGVVGKDGGDDADGTDGDMELGDAAPAPSASDPFNEEEGDAARAGGTTTAAAGVPRKDTMDKHDVASYIEAVLGKRAAEEYQRGSVGEPAGGVEGPGSVLGMENNPLADPEVAAGAEDLMQVRVYLDVEGAMRKVFSINPATSFLEFRRAVHNKAGALETLYYYNTTIDADVEVDDDDSLLGFLEQGGKLVLTGMRVAPEEELEVPEFLRRAAALPPVDIAPPPPTTRLPPFSAILAKTNTQKPPVASAQVTPQFRAVQFCGDNAADDQRERAAAGMVPMNFAKRMRHRFSVAVGANGREDDFVDPFETFDGPPAERRRSIVSRWRRRFTAASNLSNDPFDTTAENDDLDAPHPQPRYDTLRSVAPAPKHIAVTEPL